VATFEITTGRKKTLRRMVRPKRSRLRASASARPIARLIGTVAIE
jgi:hypothetical protein